MDEQMSADACATPGCGHPKVSHGTEGCAARRGGRQLAKERACPCTAYLPPRPIPEEACVCGHRKDEHGGGRCHHLNYGSGCEVHACSSCNGYTPATVPAPHAEAEAAWDLPEHKKNLRKLWRDVAEKGIEQGVDYPRIVLTLFADIDAARSELAAANTRVRELEREADEQDKAHEGIVAMLGKEAKADIVSARAKVDLLAQRLDDMTLSRDKHRTENAALSARLERVRALADDWNTYASGIETTDVAGVRFGKMRDVTRILRAALGEDA